MRRVFKDEMLNEAFEQDGYVVVDFLDNDEIATLSGKYYSMHHDYGLNPTFVTSLMMDKDDNYRHVISAAVERAFKRPVEELFDDHKWFFGHFLVKHKNPDAQYDGRVPLHQDSSMVDESQFHSINIWCTLTDTNQDNGTLQVVKGSHKINNYPRGYGQGFNKQFPYIEFEDLLRKEYLTAIPLKAGQAIISNTKLLHASQPNNTDIPRLAASGLVGPAESQLRYYYFDPLAGKTLEVFEVDPEYYLGTAMFSRPDDTKYKKIATLPIGFDRVDLETLTRIVPLPDGKKDLRKQLQIFLPPALNKWQQLAIDGMVFLLQQSSDGFAEAHHKMQFPAAQGFTSGVSWHEGDVFQRALIADTLCDCNVWMNGQLTPVIADEIDYLLGCCRKDDIGGWAYFPHLPELPADTDDLAQVMQLLIHTGNTDMLQQYCKTPLHVLLANQCYPDGGIGSWILPKEPQTPLQAMQQQWAATAWGDGADPEVVANMLYTLQLYDREKYAEIISKGTQYLLRKMNPAGYWDSTWYFGPYYGTFVCLRAILQTDAAIDLTTIYTFIKRSRLEHGGWGLNGTADPLQTSLALLCLYHIYKSGQIPVDYDCLDETSAYFTRIKNNEEPFSDCPFIKMSLGRTSGQITQVIEFGSHTMAISYITKAACCISSLVETSRDG
jgi:ectoine hydroxylase-related dioxygenase (phytanoyl-CoA dioxygenase family)